MKAQLRSGNYRFSLLSRVPPKDGEETDLRSARDAPVLKALAPGRSFASVAPLQAVR
jgi:hypothetical protein